MAFTKEMGQCCLVLPLKLGVGLIGMAAFASACVCLLALVGNDIRFQPNGYDQNFMFVPSIVGAGGLVFGFVGLLGAYDNKPGWVRAFYYFMLVKLVGMAVAMVADYVKLWECDSWLKNHALGDNVAMEVLAQAEVCPWARWAYLIGCSADFGFWAYCTVKVWMFLKQLELDTTYAIDFGREKYDVEARWKLFQVQDPTPEMVRAAQLRKQSLARKAKAAEDEEAKAVGLPTTSYGSIASNGDGEAQQLVHHDAYGPDGMPTDR